MHKIIFISILVFLSNSSLAQDLTGDVYGRVFDFVTKQPIPFANVIVLGTDYGAATNEDGFQNSQDSLLILIKFVHLLWDIILRPKRTL